VKNNHMTILMDKIYEEVKDNQREFKYLRSECQDIKDRLDKNDRCHTDIKNRLVDQEKTTIRIEGEVSPMKKIMWIVLGLLITSVGGAILSLVFIK